MGEKDAFREMNFMSVGQYHSVDCSADYQFLVSSDMTSLALPAVNVTYVSQNIALFLYYSFS